MKRIFILFCLLAALASIGDANNLDSNRWLLNLITGNGGLLGLNHLTREKCDYIIGRGLPLTRLSNGRAYYFSGTTTTATWQNARTLCRNNNLRLVAFSDFNEYNLVFQHATTLAMVAAGTGFWTGLNALSARNFFRFEADNSTPTFQAWAAAEPAVAAGSDCVRTNGVTAATAWLTNACNAAFPFVCEVPNPCSTLVTATSPAVTTG